MNAAHLHLALNHVPVIGIVFVLVLGLGALIRRSHELERATLWGFILVAALSVPAYLSGEPAEEMVESLPGVSEAAIEEHEEAAAFALAFVELTGLLALAALVLGRRGNGWERALFGLVLLSALTTATLMARTATLGGEIRHPEIRSGPPSAGEAPGADD